MPEYGALVLPVSESLANSFVTAGIEKTDSRLKSKYAVTLSFPSTVCPIGFDTAK